MTRPVGRVGRLHRRTGVWPDNHGVRGNSFEGKRYGTYPDFLTRMERYDPSLTTLSIVDWDDLHLEGSLGPEVDTRITYDGESLGYQNMDVNVTGAAVHHLRHQDPDPGSATTTPVPTGTG